MGYQSLERRKTGGNNRNAAGYRKRKRKNSRRLQKFIQQNDLTLVSTEDKMVKLKDGRFWTTPSTLNVVELKNYAKFLRSLPKEYKDKKIYFRWEGGSGIGISVHVKCEEIEKDITDYDTW